MSDYPHKILCCRSLAPTLEELLGSDAPLTILDIALHLQPERLRAALLETIAELEAPGTTILLGYGLCGRALEGVYSKHSRLVLPKIDDCVGMFLGSRERHRESLRTHSGRYWLERSWLDTELDIFKQLYKDLGRIPEKYHDRIVKMTLKHYDRLVLFRDDHDDAQAVSYCENTAKEYGMTFERIDKDLGLLRRLVFGPWEPEEFIIVEPGTPVPFF